MQIAAEYVYGFDNVHRPGIYIRFDSKVRMGLETGWATFLESLDTGKLDYLTIGDFNLTARFAQNRSVQFRFGLGAKVMIDKENSTAGINFLYEMDIFPFNPMIISASIDLGTLGNAFSMHGRFRLGASIKGMEPYLGYDIFLIGDVVFKGPAIGVRKWF